MRLLLCMILYLVGVIQCAPTANATTTSEYFEAPSFTHTRTLWNIISSSVLTLFACTYSAIHPNIPSPKDSPFRILWRRLGIMIMALIAPELIVTWAMRQWLSACRVTKQFRESGYPNIPQPQEQSETVSSAVHGTPVSTSRYGGTDAVTNPFKKFFSEQSEDYAWTQTHSFFLLMGGFMLYVDGNPYHTLRPDEFLNMIRKGCIDAPTITDKQIQDKSKGNAISKGLIMIQVAWFVLQFFSRVKYHLEITQLEMGTLAFAGLNFGMYITWWNKPLDVQRPHPVHWKSTNKSKPEDHFDNVSEDRTVEHPFVKLLSNVAVARPFLELAGCADLRKPTHHDELRVLTFDGSIKVDAQGKWVLICAGILMATAFGGIHCMAWNLAIFPSYQERVLWHAYSVTITLAPCMEVLYFFTLKSNTLPVWLREIYLAGTVIYGMHYITSRMMLFILMFTSLRNLPLGAYKAVSWIISVPHL